MRKFLLALLGVALIFLVGQKTGFLNYFKTDSRTLKNTQPTNTSFVEISEEPNRPIIGIHYRMIDKQTAIQNELVEGAYVTQVIKGSPAEKSNLQEEDIITEINGQTVSGLDEQSLYNLIIALKPGAQINLKVWRNGEIRSIVVILD